MPESAKPFSRFTSRAAQTLAAAGNLAAPGPVTSVHLADAAAEGGDFQLAESIYAKAAAASPGDATLQVKYADALLRRNQVAQARSVLANHLKTVRDPQLLHGPLGAIYTLQGEAGQAGTEWPTSLTSLSGLRTARG